MTTRELKLYSYYSRAKINQLYDQLNDFSVSEKSVRRNKKGSTSAEVKSGIWGVLTGALKGEASIAESIEHREEVRTIQKLRQIIRHIQKHENVGNLNDIMTTVNVKEQLNAFCYTYRGDFAVLGVIPRRPGRFSTSVQCTSHILVPPDILVHTDGLQHIVHPDAWKHIPGIKQPQAEFSVTPMRQLVRPARLENDIQVLDEEGFPLVSDICVLGSRTNRHILQLACSYKYFTSMMNGGVNEDGEHLMAPDSSSAMFFYGEHTMPFECIVFVTGISEETIMGTPLMLEHARLTDS